MFERICLAIITLSLVSVANSLIRLSKSNQHQLIFPLMKIDKQKYLDEMFGRNDKK